MNHFSLRLAGTCLVYIACHAEAAVHYVDLTSTNAIPPYTSWSTAATVIQDAIEVADSGDLILVTNGIYQSGGRSVYNNFSNRVAVTRPVAVQSVSGPQATLIVGYQVPGNLVGTNAVRCVYLTNGAVLSGFTLTNGATRDYGAPGFQENGGGVWSESTDSLVTNCVFTANVAESDGGGAYRGTLVDCTLTRNSASSGGGAAFSTLSNSLLTSNSVSIYGGGVIGCSMTTCMLISNSSAGWGGAVSHGVSSNCTLIGNWAGSGGGAFQATLIGCTVAGNFATNVGGGAFQSYLFRTLLEGNVAPYAGGAFEGNLQGCALMSNVATLTVGGGTYNSTLTNCTLTGNVAVIGGGAYNSTLYNCIAYYNYARTSDDNFSAGTLNYCCTTPSPPAGIGNITSEPRLASAIHLGADSPCHGSGSADYSIGTDTDGDAWNNPPAIGCDETSTSITGALSAAIQIEYTNVAAGFDVAFAALIGGHAKASRWDFGDGTVLNHRAYASHRWTAAGDYQVILTVDNDSYPSGITATGMVHVIDEVHYVSAASSSPVAPYLTWATAARNIQAAVAVASLPGSLILVSNGLYGSDMEPGNVGTFNRVALTKPLRVQSLNGASVTLIRGERASGWTPVRCAYLTNGASLTGFTITNGGTINSGSDADKSGGGVWCESSHAVVSDCIIRGNLARYYGGGVRGGAFNNCTIINNQASAYGGGAGNENNNTTLNRCSLTGNSSPNGGGSYLGLLNNCLVVSNTSPYGGGAWGGILNNCTVVSNSSFTGGGTFLSTVRNSIVYNNTATSDSNYSGGNLSYCCTAPLPGGGVGNLADPPRFVDPSAGNLRLQGDSPCVNAGKNDFASGDADRDGNVRIMNGSVDIGAYEFALFDILIFSQWLQKYGLPTNGSADYTDPDGDGAINWQEWIAGTIPTNAASVLKILSSSKNPGGLSVNWRSVSNRTYFLQRAVDLAAPSAFSALQSNIVGQAGTTTFTDTTATNGGPYFYRVGVQ